MSTRHRLGLAIIFSGSFIARVTRKPITFPRRCIRRLASLAACERKTKAPRDGYCTRDNRNNGGQETMLSVRSELGLETEIAVTFSASFRVSNVSRGKSTLPIDSVPFTCRRCFWNTEKKSSRRVTLISASFETLDRRAPMYDVQSFDANRISRIGSMTAGAFNLHSTVGASGSRRRDRRKVCPSLATTSRGNRRVYSSLWDSCVTLTRGWQERENEGADGVQTEPPCANIPRLFVLRFNRKPAS